MPIPSSRSTLPSPRDLLTSIFDSLPQSLPPTVSGLPNNANSNPLKALNATHRSLLVTLHVLFPSIFLQALDLLDRGLVTRVIQVTPSTAQGGQTPTVWPPQAHFHLPVTDQVERDQSDQLSEGSRQDQNQKYKENTIYLVRSSQSTHSRITASSSRYTTAQPLSYIIRLSAWNCSCAAFAFSAFPASASVSFSPRFEDRDVQALEPSRDSGWEFGGLSYDGKDEDGSGGRGGVPCCKHLMACVLAERWEGVLGGYVKQMRVGREEMAGLGADGGA